MGAARASSRTPSSHGGQRLGAAASPDGDAQTVIPPTVTLAVPGGRPFTATARPRTSQGVMKLEPTRSGPIPLGGLILNRLSLSHQNASSRAGVVVFPVRR